MNTFQVLLKIPMKKEDLGPSGLFNLYFETPMTPHATLGPALPAG
jgi:hypothetical protein